MLAERSKVQLVFCAQSCRKLQQQSAAGLERSCALGPAHRWIPEPAPSTARTGSIWSPAQAFKKSPPSSSSSSSSSSCNGSATFFALSNGASETQECGSAAPPCGQEGNRLTTNTRTNPLPARDPRFPKAKLIIRNTIGHKTLSLEGSLFSSMSRLSAFLAPQTDFLAAVLQLYAKPTRLNSDSLVQGYWGSNTLPKATKSVSTRDGSLFFTNVPSLRQFGETAGWQCDKKCSFYLDSLGSGHRKNAYSKVCCRVPFPSSNSALQPGLTLPIGFFFN